MRHPIACATAVLQYDLLKFDEGDYTKEEREMLKERFANMQLLLIDNGRDEAMLEPWPPQWHYLPYSTNFHYVPEDASRNASIAGPLYQPGHFDASITAVRSPL